MQLDLKRTIVAVSSAISPGRRAIVRLSGRMTAQILRALAGDDPSAEKTSTASIALNSQRAISFVAPRLNVGLAGIAGESERFIQARIYYWPDHRCFTGEPSAEIHLIGSLPIVESLVNKIHSLGASPADRGEFTLRSFLAGKLDLTQAEAVLGVIEADEGAELSWALGQLGGNISAPVRQIRDEVVELLAHLEAGLDFVEEDIEFISDQLLIDSLFSVSARLDQLSSQLESRGSRSREAQVVLLGAPNAGKSSLFNALLGKQRAIVSSEAGTTRDALTETLELDGLNVELVDTAGAEELTGDSPRAQAQTVLKQRLEQADAILLCIDVNDTNQQSELGAIYRDLIASSLPVLVVGTKIDLIGENVERVANHSGLKIDAFTSSAALATVDTLRIKLLDLLANANRNKSSDAMHRTMVRCQRSIDLARAAIARALDLVELAAGEELVATELRLALEDLAAVIGEVHNEDILGEIFSRFCIGK